MMIDFSYRTKNRLLLLGLIVGIIISWNLAFKKTVNSIILNQKLRSQSVNEPTLSYNPEYLKLKSELLEKLLRKYSIDSTEWKDDFWLRTSHIAASYDIHVDFHPGKINSLTADTSSILRESISYEGGYKNLILLLDSIHETQGTGLITSATFSRQYSSDPLKLQPLRLTLVFSILKK